jgi:hypothetical protein
MGLAMTGDDSVTALTGEAGTPPWARTTPVAKVAAMQQTLQRIAEVVMRIMVVSMR